MLHEFVQRGLHVERVAASQADQVWMPRNPVIWGVGVSRIDSDIHGIEVGHLQGKKIAQGSWSGMGHDLFLEQGLQGDERQTTLSTSATCFVASATILPDCIASCGVDCSSLG